MYEGKTGRVYIGRIPRTTRQRDLERFFHGFGKICEVAVKPGFGFIVRLRSIHT